MSNVVILKRHRRLIKAGLKPSIKNSTWYGVKKWTSSDPPNLPCVSLFDVRAILTLRVSKWLGCKVRWEGDYTGKIVTTSIFLLFFKKINLFIYWLRWVFVAACGLSLVVLSRGYSLLRCAGFSLWWLLLLRSTGSRRTGFSSCGMWAQ